MQPNLFPFPNPLVSPFLFNGALNFNSNLTGGDAEGFQFQTYSSFFLVSFLLFQGDGMDLSKVGDKILSSVRSARSLGLLPSTSDRPEVPARAAAAAVVARALAGIPPHQRFSIHSSSEELTSIYGRRPYGEEVVEELEEDFYEEEFDPIKHILEHIPSEESDLVYFEKQATLRLAQLDKVAERLSRQVMDHHEVMVKGMHLVREVEKDLKVANVICMNSRRHLNSSRNEVSRDLVVNSDSKKKQALQNVLPILNELRHALVMQAALDSLVAEGNYCKAFQVLSEYLQLLDSFSELTVIQEMGRGVEVWLGKTLQSLDSLLLGVCQEFQVDDYITVIDAYSLIGDISGLAEKIQSFFLQEVLSETHSVLKNVVQEDQDGALLSSRLTFSDLCLQIPESKFRQCLLRTLAALFKLMCSYHIIMSFQPEEKVTASQPSDVVRTLNESSLLSGEVQEIDPVSRSSLDLEINNESSSNFVERLPELASIQETNSSSIYLTKTVGSSVSIDSRDPDVEAREEDTATSSSGSPWYHLRRDATTIVSQTLQRGHKNIWQLITSRVSVLLSCNAACSTSIHQFLRNYEDLNVFILAGEAFCGVEAVEFRQKLKAVCQSYFSAFHRQNIYALKMVLERETWLRLPPETLQVISFTGLVGDGAALIVSSDGNSVNSGVLHLDKSMESFEVKKKGFSQWLEKENLFSLKLTSISKEGNSSMLNGRSSGPQGGKIDDALQSDKASSGKTGINHVNGITSVSEEENEDLLADFIDEDSQLPSRVSKPILQINNSSNFTDEEISAQTGSSLSLLRSMDKYARLMQKLEIINIEIFKGICQLFEIFFLFVFETFGQQSMHSNGKGVTDSLNYRLKTALSRINQDCDQWAKGQLSLSSPTSLNSTTFGHMDVTPVSPPSTSLGSFGLKERCAGADSISLVSRLLYKSKPHLQLILLQHNSKIVEDFYVNLVNSVPALTEHIHRTTARLLLHINGYADRVANAKWEPKELGLEHNGYVDLLLGEFKHYKTRLAHGGIHKEVQDLLLEYGLENVAETLIEGLSRVKRCTDEGRALMSLDLQVLINGLRHFVSKDVKPKFQTVEAFIKAYYLPETEFVHWARAHPEYSKSQVVGLINLVALMKGWKRKTRLEILEKIE